MKALLTCLALVFLIDASQSYFLYERPVQADNASGQRYVVVDETIWQHSREDLDDLRLYAGEHEIPYAFVVERGGMEDTQKTVDVLQPATVNGKTQFLLNMSGMPEYNRIDLNLTAHDFVANATIQGQDDLHGAHWATLGNRILYDLSDDRLGGNSALRLPLTTYRFLRITVDGPVKPTDIKSATAEVKEEQKAVWRNTGTLQGQVQDAAEKSTVITFQVPEGVPVERAVFAVDPAQPNFERDVEIRTEHDGLIARGSIDRIHLTRHGQKIDSEQSVVDLRTVSTGIVKIVIDNGDDPPLPINSVTLQQYERRLYFNVGAGQAPVLYYGDGKLSAPIYDYAKLFQQEANARQLALEAETKNAAYTGRPDDRPWSERHPAVLWAAILAAVVVLGAVALRSMKTATPGNNV